MNLSIEIIYEFLLLFDKTLILNNGENKKKITHKALSHFVAFFRIQLATFLKRLKDV